MGEIKKLHRRSIRLQGYDYSSLGDYHITINTYHKQPLFGIINEEKLVPSEVGRVVERIWMDIPRHFPFVELGPFVVMPNHFHGIISIVDETGRGTACCAPTSDIQIDREFGKMPPHSIPAIIRSFKSAVTHEIRQSIPNLKNPVWQRNYYEHIIGSDEDYDIVAAYIEYNPSNWSSDKENAGN